MNNTNDSCASLRKLTASYDRLHDAAVLPTRETTLYSDVTRFATVHLTHGESRKTILLHRFKKEFVLYSFIFKTVVRAHFVSCKIVL